MDPAQALARVLTPAPPAKPSSLKRLAHIAARIPETADLVLFGDSLAAAWPEALLHSAFPGWRVFNFGLPGDRVQNSLWRLASIPTTHLRPRALVMLLGTNNLGDGDPPEAIAQGLAAVLEAAIRQWGDPAAFVVTIPRRGEAPGFRQTERSRLNAELAGLRATLLDADAALVPSPGEEPCLLADMLHLSEAGYRRLGAALAAAIGAAARQNSDG